MEHTTRGNLPKIVGECEFPLTAQRCVTTIITDIADIDMSSEALMLCGTAPGWSVADVQRLTEPRLIFSR